METNKTFATVAFSFVLGYAKRMLHIVESHTPVFRGHGVPPAKSESQEKEEKRLGLLIEELHRLWDAWIENEG